MTNSFFSGYINVSFLIETSYMRSALYASYKFRFENEKCIVTKKKSKLVQINTPI